MRPFYSQNNLVLKIVLFIYPSILLVRLNRTGLINYNPQCGVTTGPWSFMLHISAIGQSTSEYLMITHDVLSPEGGFRLAMISDTVLQSVQFILPYLIVLASMALQMIYIKKAFRGHENSQLNTANQVNLTVFLISFLYLSSVSLYSMSAIMYLQPIHIPLRFTLPFFEFIQLTLPLINAALFPTILILRKPELRARYRNYINIAKCLLLPSTIYEKVRNLARRRRGYAEI